MRAVATSRQMCSVRVRQTSRHNPASLRHAQPPPLPANNLPCCRLRSIKRAQTWRRRKPICAPRGSISAIPKSARRLTAMSATAQFAWAPMQRSDQSFCRLCRRMVSGGREFQGKPDCGSAPRPDGFSRCGRVAGEAFHGRVVSIAPATGAQFSVLPPENATGNFTKIVQRVPVRILLEGDASQLGRLRPGLSVTADVDTRTGG